MPAARLATIDAAGRAGIPFTSGILIGIGETRAERIDALLAIRDMHMRYGHIQVRGLSTYISGMVFVLQHSRRSYAQQ